MEMKKREKNTNTITTTIDTIGIIINERTIDTIIDIDTEEREREMSEERESLCAHNASTN